MSLDFKKCWFLLVVLGASFSSIAQQVDGVVYNLRQNWVQYDIGSGGFMPSISQTRSNTVSFQIDTNTYRSQLLYIKNHAKAYLFNGNVLIAELGKGEFVFEIDSISRYGKSQNQLISIYGVNVKKDLETYIITANFKTDVSSATSIASRDQTFTSFFILISAFLLMGLIIIKLNSMEIFSQYSNISRVFSLNTIDELIYKGRFFVNPGVQMVAWVSFSSAFVLYYLFIKLNIHVLNFEWLETSSVGYHSVLYFALAFAFMLFFVSRYLLIYIMSLVFDMSSTRNVHYASYLRLTFYLLLLLQFIITLDYFLLIEISTGLFLTIIFGLLLLIIILLGLRLSFIIRHTFIQLFLYLCATEIFLYVFVYKLVVG